MEILGNINDITIPLEMARKGIKVKIRVVGPDNKIVDKFEFVTKESGKFEIRTSGCSHNSIER